MAGSRTAVLCSCRAIAPPAHQQQQQLPQLRAPATTSSTRRTVQWCPSLPRTPTRCSPFGSKDCTGKPKSRAPTSSFMPWMSLRVQAVHGDPGLRRGAAAHRSHVFTIKSLVPAPFAPSHQLNHISKPHRSFNPLQSSSCSIHTLCSPTSPYTAYALAPILRRVHSASTSPLAFAPPATALLDAVASHYPPHLQAQATPPPPPPPSVLHHQLTPSPRIHLLQSSPLPPPPPPSRCCLNGGLVLRHEELFATSGTVLHCIPSAVTLDITE